METYHQFTILHLFERTLQFTKAQMQKTIHSSSGGKGKKIIHSFLHIDFSHQGIKS